MRWVVGCLVAALFMSTACIARADVITVDSRSDTIYGTDGIDSYSQTGNGPLSDQVQYFVNNFNGVADAASETGDFSVVAGASSVNTPSNESAFASTVYVLTPLTSDVAFQVSASTGRDPALSPALSTSFAFYDITLGQGMVADTLSGGSQSEDETFQFVLDPTHQYGLSLSASVGGRVGEVGAAAGVSVTFSPGTGVPTFPPPQAAPLPSPAYMALLLGLCIGGLAALRRGSLLPAGIIA